MDVTTPLPAVSVVPLGTHPPDKLPAPALALSSLSIYQSVNAVAFMLPLGASVAADGIAAEVIVVDNDHPHRGHAAGNRVAISSRGVRLIQPTANLGFGGGTVPFPKAPARPIAETFRERRYD